MLVNLLKSGQRSTRFCLEASPTFVFVLHLLEVLKLADMVVDGCAEAKFCLDTSFFEHFKAPHIFYTFSIYFIFFRTGKLLCQCTSTGAHVRTTLCSLPVLVVINVGLVRFFWDKELFKVVLARN